MLLHQLAAGCAGRMCPLAPSYMQHARPGMPHVYRKSLPCAQPLLAAGYVVGFDSNTRPAGHLSMAKKLNHACRCYVIQLNVLPCMVLVSICAAATC